MQETAKMVIDALKPVAEKLGEGAAHLYEVYMRQMFAEGVAGLIVTGVMLVVTVVFLIWFLKAMNKIRKDKAEKKYAWAEDSPYFPQAIFSGIVGVMLTVIMLIAVPSTLFYNITKIVNPEYHAINRLFEQVKGK